MVSVVSVLKNSEAPRQAAVIAALVVGVLSISTAAILFRETSAPPLAAAFYRLLFATLILAPFALWKARHELAGLSLRDALALAAVGVVLGLHFGAWVPSLALTSVASSVFLVTIHPIFVGAWGQFVSGEKPGRAGWVGIAVALAGGAFIAFSDQGIAGTRLLGDLLAVAGAFAAAAYFLAGRSLRQRLSLFAYVVPVYGGATVTLLALALLHGDRVLGYPLRDDALFVALALVPMILGHTVLNWSLAHVRAAVVSVSILFEPIGSTILALVILGESPPSGTLIGGALVLAGVVLVVRAGARAAPAT
ncbi:MAG: DMT family transporter [Thermoplasmatota archaeon]